MKKRKIDLNKFLDLLSFDLLEEECENLYINYLKEIEKNSKIITLKEKLFNYILKKNIYIKK
jgi:hypothetical protein